MPSVVLARPASGDNAPYYDAYISRVGTGDLVAIMSQQVYELDALLRPVTEQVASRRYARDKWSLKQVAGHLIDSERVFAFRAAAFSRNEIARLPSFDQDAWIAAADYDERSMPSILDEWCAVRRASIEFLRALPAHALARRGIASDVEFTVLAALCVLPGHVTYHIAQIHDRYLAS
jgi:hypothetical protein